MPHTHVSFGFRSSIIDLPNEVLLIIFKFAYVATRRLISSNDYYHKRACLVQRRCFCDIAPEETCTLIVEKMTPPFTQFPYALASVCSRWREIMLDLPIFWTLIIIPIDADADAIFSLPNLELQLCASRDQPIDVVVTRISFEDVAGLKDVEQFRMSQIITALRSHFHRCRTLRIETVHSSSLPRLSVTLPANMPHIRELSLESRIDSGCPKAHPYRQDEDIASIHCCKLNTVAIDGWNFTELCDRVPSPSQQIFSECSSISIKFGGEGHSSNCIRKLIEDCPIESLHVDSVNFTQRDHSQGHSNLRIFTLRNLSAEVTGVMLQVCDFATRLTIDNCSATPTEGTTSSDELTLENIGPDQGLENMLYICRGTHLVVDKCPDFNDDILTMTGTNSCLATASTLYIHGCHGYTVNALKELVEFRGNDAMFHNLSVHRSGFFSEKELRWFRKRVDGEVDWYD